MQDLINQFTNASDWAIPILGLMTGAISSAHCLSMCGGLIIATTHTTAHQVSYHLGRYLGYLGLTLLASSLGLSINLLKIPALNILLGVMVGVALIAFGLKNYISFDPFKLFADKVLNSPSQKILGSSYLRSLFHPSFPVGLATAFLPCGVLWGVVLALMGTQDQVKSILGISFFWLGTLPVLVIAPMEIHRFMKLKAGKFAHLINLSFIAIGLITILMKIQGPIHLLHNQGSNNEELTCH